MDFETTHESTMICNSLYQGLSMQNGLFQLGKQKDMQILFIDNKLGIVYGTCHKKDNFFANLTTLQLQICI